MYEEYNLIYINQNIYEEYNLIYINQAPAPALLKNKQSRFIGNQSRNQSLNQNSAQLSLCSPWLSLSIDIEEVYML